MEFPSFHHHHHHHHNHNRYVPPPPPPKSFSDDRANPYLHRHHLLPPFRPPPPPLSYPSLPPPPPPHPIPSPLPPPSYNPHPSNFTFLDSQSPSFLNQRRSPPPQPRFSNQSHGFDYRTHSWSDPHRIPLEHPNRNPVMPNDHHRRFYSSTPESESYYNPNGSERDVSTNRYRDDTIVDGYSGRDIGNIVLQDPQVFRDSPINNDHHGRIFDRYASSHSVTAINEATGSSSRNLEDFVEKYEPRHMTSLENGRIWARRGNEDPRRDHSLKGKMNEFGQGGNDGVSIVNSRDQSRNYGNELSKFSKVREGKEEFKQVQKKSVLLRIGKPNNTYRNRNHEQHFSKTHLVDSNNSNFRCKDKDKDRDHIGKDSSLFLDQKMEGGRERSLVELDVSFKSNGLVAKAVVTPSSPVFDENYTQPRNRKIKRAAEFDSPSTKGIDRSIRSRSSSHGIECSLSSEKAPKQPRDNDSVDDCVNRSSAGPVTEQGGGGTGGSYRPLSFRLRKKRKLMNIDSHASNVLLAEKDDKSVKGENIKDGPRAPIIPFPSLEELTVSNVNESPETMVSEKHGSEVQNPSLHDIQNFSDNHTEIKNLTAEEVSAINDVQVKDISQPLSQNEAPPNLDNETQMVYTDVKVSLGGTDGSDLSHDQTEIQKCPTEAYDSIDAANISDNLCTVSLEMQETSTNADLNSINSCTEQIITVFSDYDDVSRKEEKTKVFEGTTNTDGTSKLPEDGQQDSSNVVVAEDNVIHSSDKSDLSVVNRMTKASGNQFNQTISGEKHENIVDALLDVSNSLKVISSNKEDEGTEIAKMNSAQKPDHREPSTDEICLLPKDDLPLPSSILSASVDGFGMIATDLIDKPGKSIADSIISKQLTPNVSGAPMLIVKSTDQTMSNLNTPNHDDDNSVSKNDASLNGIESSRITSHLEVTGVLPNTKTLPASQGTSVKTQIFDKKTHGSSLPMKKLNSASAAVRSFAGRSSQVFTNSRNNNPANIAKPRTWHRSTSNPTPVTNSSLASVPPLPKQSGTGQNSYIRSGNSLVRKAAPVNAVSSAPPASRSSVYQLNRSGQIEMKNTLGSGSKVLSNYSRAGGSVAPVIRPKTPPLPGSTKLQDSTTISSRDLPPLPVENLPMKGNNEDAASPLDGTFSVQNVSEYHKLSEAHEDENGTSSNSEGQITLDEGKKIQYLKRKSNQLVAASSMGQQSLHDLGKTQVPSSDGYYKRRKNQLIRASMGDDSVKTDVQRDSKINIKRQSVKGVFKMYKQLRFPSVWMRSSQSSRKYGVSLRLRPHLFPWKRPRYGGNINVSTSTPSNSSSSSISRKLLLSRKRQMIYTRSRHGFSLRMSKLLSVGGSSLKWSKSIERNSKRANEEATLAVAAAEKKKREQHEASEITNRNNLPRDRIFRVGLVRYKMDPSRKTLQRISDDEPSTSEQSKQEIKRYVRIGNGNQLVRNPKRRTRIFAYEKVRWSLHTARSRLAKKKKYCQFFTRFGKCNKEDGKCPYIHDSSKIAVCTKFLNGSCFNPNCKLTHKVIPERMPDCSYFSQGLCSNKHCPYRHVNVNSAASVCEGFLKGYCADGNECRKKHTYACPEFEATGKCPQGTKCKLHHPKNRNLGLKMKLQNPTQQYQKNTRGRYFGPVSNQEPIPIISETHQSKDDDDDGDDDILCHEGKFAEYISLDSGNEVFGDVANDPQTMVISEPTDLGSADFIDLTKPIAIMSKILIGSPMECDLGCS